MDLNSVNTDKYNSDHLELSLEIYMLKGIIVVILSCHTFSAEFLSFIQMAYFLYINFEVDLGLES